MALALAGRRPARGGAVSRSGPTTSPGSGRALWSAEDVIRLVLALGVGGVVIVVAWYICSGDASFNRQIGPLDAAVGGAVLAGLGNVMWLMRGRRAIGERRRALLPDPVEAAIAPVRVGPSAGEVATGAWADDGGPAARDPELFVAGQGLVRFHRAECALAVGRSWEPASRQQHEDVGRLPCGVCRP